VIKRKNDNVILEFGNGDIGVVAGWKYIGQEDGHKAGIVAFTNQEPRPIGSQSFIHVGRANSNEYPVIMLFNKKESIDVVIRKLEEAKYAMK